MKKKNIIIASIITVVFILTIILIAPHKSSETKSGATAVKENTDNFVQGTKSTGETKSDYFVDASDMVDASTLVLGLEKTELTSDEIAGLVKMREEEKLARDVYTTLGQIWGMNIFSNIASSEQTHTDAVKTLLDRYGITDTVENNNIGVFHSPEMQELYNTLTEQGRQSLGEALKVGAIIEDLDINDLETLMKATNKNDILVVYSNLQKGSRNHLRAFSKNLDRQGMTYTPTYISQEEYNSIVSTNQEKGNVK